MLDSKTPREGRFFWARGCTAAGAISLLLGWLAPNHYLPWLSFHNEVPAFLALAFFWMAWILANRPLLTGPGVPQFFLLLTLVVLAQGLSGQIHYGGDALLSLLFIACAGIAWALGVQCICSPAIQDRALTVASALFVLGASLSGLLTLLQWLHLESMLGMYIVERPPGARASGNLAQPNLLATLILMGTLFGYRLWALRHLKKWQAVSILVLLSFSLVATESRQGYLGSFCAGIFLLLYALRLRCKPLAGFVLVWWALLLSFHIAWKPLNEFLLLQSSREMQIGIDNIRIILWKQVWAAIEQSPWLGYGWRQTAVAQKIGALAVPGPVPTDYAHNIVLDVLAWVGMPLGLLLIGAVGWWVAQLARGIKSLSTALAFAATIPFFVHSMVEFPFAYAFFLFPVAAILGAVQAIDNPRQLRAVQAPARHVKACATMGLVIFLALGGKIFQEYLQAEEDMRIMRFELRQLGTTPTGYAQPTLLLLSQLDDMLRLGRIQAAPQMAPQVIERMRHANLAFNWANLHLNYVIALALNGKPEQAERELLLIGALYGPETHRQAVKFLQTMRSAKYPSLSLPSLQ